MIRAAHRRAIILLAAAGVLAMIVSCAPTTRYRVLSFFFDGVPDPNAPPSQSHKPAISQMSDFQIAMASIPRPDPTPAPRKIVSVHKPVQERKCNSCHDMTSGSQMMVSNVQMCDECHREERVVGKWNHGPINVGTCLPCHKAHDSYYPHLLSEPVRELCQSCHTQVMESKAEYHNVPEFEACTSCHNPHKI